jgi:hypothetical protein
MAPKRESGNLVRACRIRTHTPAGLSARIRRRVDSSPFDQEVEEAGVVADLRVVVAGVGPG